MAFHCAVGLDAAEVRERLRRLVPDYMIPHEVYYLKELPLGTSGKVDRKALLKPPEAGCS